MKLQQAGVSSLNGVWMGVEWIIGGIRGGKEMKLWG
jgi:hypothetical protein